MILSDDEDFFSEEEYFPLVDEMEEIDLYGGCDMPVFSSNPRSESPDVVVFEEQMDVAGNFFTEERGQHIYFPNQRKRKSCIKIWDVSLSYFFVHVRVCLY